MTYRVRAARARRARALQVKRAYEILTVIICLAVLAFGFLFSGITAHAESEDSLPAYKYYTDVMITADHTFSDIVKENYNADYYASVEDYVSEVSEINHIPYHQNTIPSATPGTHLVVPYYSYEFKK